jgi:hypothetical protein
MTPLDLRRERVLLVVLCVVTAAALIIGASTSSAAFGPFNTEWDGGSQLGAAAAANGVDSEQITDVDRYEAAPPNETVAIVLSPDRPYTTNQSATVRRFVRNGGTLVVAEDFQPYANDLLASVGARARIDGSLIRDEYAYYRSPSLPVATNVTDTAGFGSVESITLNYASYVDPNGASVLVRTSEYAYVDENRNGGLNSFETVRSYPVVTTEPVGDGRVIAISDPSALTNAMLERDGNRAFVRVLYTEKELVYLDYSHSKTMPPLAVAILAFRDSQTLQLVLGVLGVGLFIAWPRLRAGGAQLLRLRRGESIDRQQTQTNEPVDHVIRDSPDREETRLRRIANAIRDRTNE